MEGRRRRKIVTCEVKKARGRWQMKMEVRSLRKENDARVSLGHTLTLLVSLTHLETTQALTNNKDKAKWTIISYLQTTINPRKTDSMKPAKTSMSYRGGGTRLQHSMVLVQRERYFFWSRKISLKQAQGLSPKATTMDEGNPDQI